MRIVQATLIMVLACGSAFSGQLEDMLFTYGEDTYPQLFSPPGVQTMEILGYTARHYPDTNTYIGIKDGFVYIYGDIFGGLRNVGSVGFFQGIITGSGNDEQINLTGHWTGSGASTPFPVCTATLSVDLLQNGDDLTGTGTMNANCLGGQESGQIRGTVSGSQINFGVAFDAFSTIYYEGTLANNMVTFSGTYNWPDEDDYGTWTLNRQ